MGLYSVAIKEGQEKLYNVQDDLQGLEIDELRDIQAERSVNCAVCCLSVTGDLNVGVIIRTASLVGAKEVLIFGRRKYDARSVVGADNYIRVDKIEGVTTPFTLDVNKFWDTMAEKGYFPILIEGPGFTPITEPDWLEYFEMISGFGFTPCLVFGNEGSGIPESILYGSPMKGVFSIPQRGILRSYNVSSAASIAMFHIFHEVGWL